MTWSSVVQKAPVFAGEAQAIGRWLLLLRPEIVLRCACVMPPGPLFRCPVTVHSSGLENHLDRPFLDSRPSYRRDPERTLSGEHFPCLLNSSVIRPRPCAIRQSMVPPENEFTHGVPGALGAWAASVLALPSQPAFGQDAHSVAEHPNCRPDISPPKTFVHLGELSAVAECRPPPPFAALLGRFAGWELHTALESSNSCCWLTVHPHAN